MVGLNEAIIRKYIQDQERRDIIQDKVISWKYQALFWFVGKVLQSGNCKRQQIKKILQYSGRNLEIRLNSKNGQSRNVNWWAMGSPRTPFSGRAHRRGPSASSHWSRGIKRNSLGGAHGSCVDGLPERFPSSSTCYRRFSKWVKDGRFKKFWRPWWGTSKIIYWFIWKNILLTAPLQWQKAKSWKDQAG